MTGAMAGAMANIMVMCDIRRCACAPWNMSRTMARLTTTPAQAAKPCKPRRTQSCPTCPAKKQPSEARMNSTSVTRMTFRRPIASEIAPCQSDMTENMNRYEVSVCWTSSGDACSVAAMSCMAGR